MYIFLNIIILNFINQLYMVLSYYDIIIIGSGLAGLYSAYDIKNISPETSFLILEKDIQKRSRSKRAN